MKASSRVLLVILRLLIGWQFLVEGLYKFEIPWSSETYLRESSGPLAPFFRGIAGDTIVDKLTLRPPMSDVADDQESANRFPPALARDWDFYRDHLVRYYELEGSDKEELCSKLDDAMTHSKAEYVHWVITGKGGVARSSPYTGAKAVFKQTIAERLEDCADKQREINRLQLETLRPSLEAGKATRQHAEQELADAKKDLGEMRASLQDDVRQKTRKMESDLQKTLESDPGFSDKLTMPEPSLLAWRAWAPGQRGLWFGYWALLVVAAWGLAAFLRWTIQNEKTGSSGRWFFWLAWFAVILAGSTGITYVLGVPWWRSWKPSAPTWDTVVGWLEIAAAAALVVSAALVIVGFRASSAPRAPWARATGISIGATAAFALTAMLVVFGAPWFTFNRLEWTDSLVSWGLVTIGACLLTGFCTRTAAVLGALILFSFWLAMPPLPWLPPPAMSEGHYLWINKNVIEAIVLLLLAGTAVGQWAGLDGVIRFLARENDNVLEYATGVEAEGP
jgi:uncharacterized membrane protein YphA (DoxX/SURF4 family)